LWTTRQRRALLVLLAIFWLILVVRWARNRVFVSDAPEAPAARATELADRFDPNTADWQTLAAIPMLGEKKAQAIVAYRDNSIAAGRGPIIFRTAFDLTNVKGIGLSTAANIEPYLILPATKQPNTGPN
jgi:DNA uptake protein ComE-like DNA-binding protein